MSARNPMERPEVLLRPSITATTPVRPIRGGDVSDTVTAQFAFDRLGGFMHVKLQFRVLVQMPPSRGDVGMGFGKTVFDRHDVFFVKRGRQADSAGSHGHPSIGWRQASGNLLGAAR